MKPTKIIAYKAFNKNLQCRGYQFEIGKVYQHEGKVEKCVSGFHSCEYPLDLFSYYSPVDSRFALVEASGSVDREINCDTKIASEVLNINSELQISDVVVASIAWVTSKCDSVKTNHSKGDNSASSATGYNSASSATGYKSASSATGYNSASSATGDKSASSATGDKSASSATGDNSASSATGYKSASSATGDNSASSATGDTSASSATGYKSASSATGYKSASSATGNTSASSATGYKSASSATGYKSASSATGDNSASSATGNTSASSVEGKNAVAMNIGVQGKAKAGKDGAIVLCNHDENYNIRHIRASKVGENGVKADTWYVLDNNGEFQEVV